MIILIRVVAPLVSLLALQSGAAEMDMAVAQKWAYEHFQSVSNSMVSGDQIQIKGIRTYPPALLQ